jgi:hypothetical protein
MASGCSSRSRSGSPPRDRAASRTSGDARRAGFEVEGFGGDTVIVHAVPNPHRYFDAERAFREMIHELTHGSELVRSARNQHERIAMTFACKSAIKAGQRLSEAEMQELFDQLFATSSAPRRARPAHRRPPVDARARAEVRALVTERPRFLAVTGPTASGKTDLSLALAERLRIEVISMDSRQVYRGMDIGTDKVGARGARGRPAPRARPGRPGRALLGRSVRARRASLDRRDRGARPSPSSWAARGSSCGRSPTRSSPSRPSTRPARPRCAPGSGWQDRGRARSAGSSARPGAGAGSPPRAGPSAWAVRSRSRC